MGFLNDEMKWAITHKSTDLVSQLLQQMYGILKDLLSNVPPTQNRELITNGLYAVEKARFAVSTLGLSGANNSLKSASDTIIELIYGLCGTFIKKTYLPYIYIIYLVHFFFVFRWTMF